MSTRVRAFALVALLAGPLVLRSTGARTSATEGLLFVVIALGLNLTAGYAGQPSLAAGAFAGIGAYATAILRTHAGWGPVTSSVTAVAIAMLCGAIVARGVARLRPAFVALSTWIVAWTFSLAIAAFPRWTGGAAGTVVGPARIDMRPLGISFTLSTVAMYEIALVLFVVVWSGVAASVRRYGPALHALREDPIAAAAAGVPVARLRAGTLIASAAIAGAAGALLVQVAGVADPTSFAPLRSIELFIAVLLGGAATLDGPIAGALALFALSRAGAGIASLTGGVRAQIEAIGSSIVLLVVVITGGRGIASFLRRNATVSGEEPEPASLAPYGGAHLALDGISVDFGAVRALDACSLSVAPGMCHAIIGPNGSGKTTLLRVVSGALPVRGVTLDGVPIDDFDIGERVQRGVARTFQRLAVAPEVTALEHVVSGMEARRATGPVRAITATPGARAEQREIEHVARSLLATVGVPADLPTSQLTVGQRRFVQIVRALAARPRLLLLDEPSAGLDVVEEAQLVRLLEKARAEGLTIILVEHNIALVRAMADRVTVLDAGRPIAEGAPDEVAMHPAVRAAYLGAE